MNETEILFIRCLTADYIHTARSGDYAIQQQSDTLYLLFQCSDGSEDWKNNLDFPARPYGRMDEEWYAHHGFARVWKAMRKEIKAKVGARLRTDPRIQRMICVGYSHGGALALFATEDMVYHFGNRCQVSGYGFGAPRVLWGRIPTAVRDRLQDFTVVRNIPDLVTHLPPIWLGYRHVGSVMKIGKMGRYTPVDAHRPEAYMKELSVQETPRSTSHRTQLFSP